MAKQIIIPITNGKGSAELVNGDYQVSAEVIGYDSASIQPNTQEITEGVNDYDFTISASGELTVHVSDDGTDIGLPIKGAVLYRTDSAGNVYGDPVTTDDDGIAVFKNVPFSDTGTAPTVYYKQTESDGQHTFPTEVQNATLNSSAITVELANTAAQERLLNLTDANYSGLPVEDGNVTFTSN